MRASQKRTLSLTAVLIAGFAATSARAVKVDETKSNHQVPITVSGYAGESQAQERIAVFGGSFSCIEPSKVAKCAWTNAFDVKVLNFGMGGMGFVAGADKTNDIPNQVKRALAKGEKYRAFVLWASTNDIWRHTVQEQNDAIERCVRMIRASQPESRIVMFASMPVPLQPHGNALLARFVDGQKETCRKLLKPPYVCNGCPDQSSCTLEKRVYDAGKAQDEYS